MQGGAEKNVFKYRYIKYSGFTFVLYYTSIIIRSFYNGRSAGRFANVYK